MWNLVCTNATPSLQALVKALVATPSVQALVKALVTTPSFQALVKALVTTPSFQALVTTPSFQALVTTPSQASSSFAWLGDTKSARGVVEGRDNRIYCQNF